MVITPAVPVVVIADITMSVVSDRARLLANGVIMKNLNLHSTTRLKLSIVSEHRGPNIKFLSESFTRTPNPMLRKGVLLLSNFP